jgi:hypothetical protein
MDRQAFTEAAVNFQTKFPSEAPGFSHLAKHAANTGEIALLTKRLVEWNARPKAPTGEEYQALLVEFYSPPKPPQP